MKLHTIAVVFISALGCSSATPTPAATPKALPVAASQQRTWNAVVGVLSDRNIPVKTMDKGSGFVTAELTGVSRGDFLKLADCGSFTHQALIGGVGSGIARYSILVRGDSVASTVKVSAKFTGLPNHGGVTDCTSRGIFEEALSADIKQRAEGK
jgi:hypothetical protein